MPDLLDLGELCRDPLFEFGVPVSKLRRLPPHLVAEPLDAQHRAHPGDKGSVFEGFRQIVVAARLEPSHHILVVGLGGDEDVGMKGSEASALSRRATSIPSIFGIMISRRIKSGSCSFTAISAASPSSSSTTS